MTNAAGSRVGVAMIGAGFIAEYHLAALALCDRAAVRVVVGRDPARARAVADRFGVADAVGIGPVDDPAAAPAGRGDGSSGAGLVQGGGRAAAGAPATFASERPVATAARAEVLAATLARPDVDAVIVATPDDTHEAIALAAIAERKAVLLQKPMATTSEACRRIVDAASAARVDLQVSFMHRYFPEVQLARRLVVEEAIGVVHSIRVRNATPGPDWADWFFEPERVSGGVVYQLGVHGIDLALLLLGPIAEVSARTATLQPSRRLASGRTAAVRNPDSAWGTYTFESGPMGNHEMSMIERQGCDRFRLELYGNDGTIWLRTERGACAVHAPRWLDHDGWWLPALPGAPFGKAQHERWLDGLTGREPPEATARDALAGMQVAEAVMRSGNERGCSVRVDAGPGADSDPFGGVRR